MISWLRIICLFLFPAGVTRLLFRLFRVKSVFIGKNCHIGFSLISCQDLFLADGSSIGHLNYIKNDKCHIAGGKICHLNIVKGHFSLIMDEGAWMNSQNKIASNWKEPDRPRVMHLRKNVAIIMKHTFDLTDSIEIGEGCLFAGVGTQVWTHAFYLGENEEACVVGAVKIGKKCYIGSGVIICSGVEICDRVVLGAGVTVAKDIIKPGLYVNQPLRFVDFNADEAIAHLGNPIIPELNIYRKSDFR